MMPSLERCSPELHVVVVGIGHQNYVAAHYKYIEHGDVVDSRLDNFTLFVVVHYKTEVGGEVNFVVVKRCVGDSASGGEHGVLYFGHIVYRAVVVEEVDVTVFVNYEQILALRVVSNESYAGVLRKSVGTVYIKFVVVGALMHQSGPRQEIDFRGRFYYVAEIIGDSRIKRPAAVIVEGVSPRSYGCKNSEYDKQNLSVHIEEEINCVRRALRQVLLRLCHGGLRRSFRREWPLRMCSSSPRDGTEGRIRTLRSLLLRGECRLRHCR